MSITIELNPEVEQWVAANVASGAFASPSDFVNARLAREWLEDKIEEAFLEPASPLTPDDWAETHRQLESAIAKQK